MMPLARHVWGSVAAPGGGRHKKEVLERGHRRTNKRESERAYMKTCLCREGWRKVEDIVVDMAGDGLLEGGASDGEGMLLRDCGPWRTHIGARTPPEGLHHTGNPYWSREGVKWKGQQEESTAHWLLPPESLIASAKGLGGTKSIVWWKKGENEARKGEAEIGKCRGVVFLRYLIVYNLYFSIPKFIIKSLVIGNKSGEISQLETVLRVTMIIWKTAGITSIFLHSGIVS